MKHLSRPAVFAALLVFAGCATTTQLLTNLQDWAVGTYRATAQQIKVADMRAAAYFAKNAPAEGEKYKGQRYLAVRTLDPTPEQWQEIRAEMSKPASRYGAPSSAPQKVHCVMIWDTQTQQVVGSNCYAVVKFPAPGETVRFDTYTAQFVGSL